jgi:FkbM family methyltransferase
MGNRLRSAEFKRLVRSLCPPVIERLLADKQKTRTRERVMNRPMSPDYPFEPEVKLIGAIGLGGRVALDVGANTGLYSTILERIVGSGNLYIFEPLPHLHVDLKRRFAKAHVFDIALSDREGVEQIRVPYIGGKRYDTRASLNDHAEANQTSFEAIEVRLSSLDVLVKQVGIDSIGFIKIDVEGHELQVIEGAVETIERFHPLMLVEIETRHHRFPISEIFARLETMGYRGHYIDPASFELLPVARFDSARDQKQEDLEAKAYLRYLNNFFFVHETEERDFVAKVAGFLDAEKRSMQIVEGRP